MLDHGDEFLLSQCDRKVAREDLDLGPLGGGQLGAVGFFKLLAGVHALFDLLSQHGEDFGFC